MLNKGTKLYSIFNAKCPVCHEGDFFVSSAYNLKRIGDLHEKCSSCGVIYAKEPGCYYGAMYVAYSLGVAIFVSIWLITLILGIEIDLFDLFLIISGVIVLATPYLYHLSKIVWANLFFHYKK